MTDDPKHKVRVLLVDDDVAMCRALSRYLTLAKIDVDVAHNGEDAIGLVDKGAYDVILSDFSMPGLNGLELLRRIRDCNSDLPVILMTAQPSVEMASEAVELGVFRFLSKPVDAERVVSTVRLAAKMHLLSLAKSEALALIANGGLGIADHASLGARFDGALATLRIVFQPIVSWSERRIHGYEALVRTDEKSMPNPGVFLEAAERLGRIHELGRHIRARAARDFEVAPLDARLFVNLHTLDLEDNSLFDAGSPLSLIAERVTLEVTERASFEGVRNVRARAAILRKIGYKIAIDDLGAGYAGLTGFALLEPEVVKLDMGLIRDVHREPTKQRIVRAILGLCDETDITVVAEGVETRAERDMLASLGCDLMQGYLFARPGAAFPDVSWE